MNIRGVLGGTLLLLSSVVWAQETEQSREIPNFTRLEVGSALDVEVRMGPAGPAKLKGPEELLKRVILRANGDTLKAFMEPSSGWRSIGPSQSVRITLTTPTLRSVDTGGASSVRLAYTNKDPLVIEAGGASEVKVSQLDLPKLSVDASGGSRVELKGKAKQVDVEVSGGADVRAEELVTERASVDGSGGSRTEINVVDSLVADMSGGSRVVVLGNPKHREVELSGGARVNYR